MKKIRLRDKNKLLLIFLILILFGVNYPFLDKTLKNLFVNYEVGIVERVVDGDTLIANGSSVRLLGINTPEKGEEFYEQAKLFLENLTLNKFVKLEIGKTNKDMYNRSLRYIILDGENINLKLVENGLANYYFPSGKDRYYNTFKEAWENCIEKNLNLCKKSEDKCADCVVLKKLDVNGQEIVLFNKCSFKCDLSGWRIKDEGRKNFVFPDFVLDKEVSIKVEAGKDSEDVLYWKGKEYVWTETGDTIFLRDADGKLVLWWGY